MTPGNRVQLVDVPEGAPKWLQPGLLGTIKQVSQDWAVVAFDGRTGFRQAVKLPLRCLQPASNEGHHP